MSIRFFGRSVARNKEANKQERSSRCTYTFADGRRCRTPRHSGSSSYCYFHARKQAQAQAAEDLGRDISFFFSGRYVSACDLGSALGRVFTAAAQGDIKPTAAAKLAYLGQVLVQTIHLAQGEYIDAFGTDGWRNTIFSHVQGTADYMNRHHAPDSQPDQPPQPQPDPPSPSVPAPGPSPQTTAPQPTAPVSPQPQPAAPPCSGDACPPPRVTPPSSTPTSCGAGFTPLPSTPAPSDSDPTPPSSPLPSSPRAFAEAVLHLASSSGAPRSEPEPVPAAPAIAAGRSVVTPHTDAFVGAGLEPGSSVDVAWRRNLSRPGRETGSSPQPALRPMPSEPPPVVQGHVPKPKPVATPQTPASPPTSSVPSGPAPAFASASAPPRASDLPGFGKPANWDALIPSKPTPVLRRRRRGYIPSSLMPL